MKKLLTLTLLLLLTACGGTAALEPTAVPEPLPTQPVAEPVQITPEPTPVPPTPTAEPSPIPTPTLYPTYPTLVWLPYGTGTYGNPIAILRDGEMLYEPEPVPIEIFFDYNPFDGQIAYGSKFWDSAGENLDSVTDLWVYDYATKLATQWLEGGVGRAAWSPVPNEDGLIPLAIALHNGQNYDLALLTGPNEVEILGRNIDPYFAWSPDGRQMAYVHEGNLFTAALPITGMVETLWASDVYANGGWIGDAPVWDLERNLLIYADEPFAVIDMTTGEVIRPILPSELAPARPTKLLWAADLRQLIVQEEGMMGNTIRVYELAEDWRSVPYTYAVENTMLLGWYTEGESVMVLDETSRELRIRPLTE